MSYVPTVWKDRVVDNPRTYLVQENTDGTITLIPEPGVVHEEGTPVIAANMNKIEIGLEDAIEAAGLAQSTANAALPKSGGTMTGSLKFANSEVWERSFTQAENQTRTKIVIATITRKAAYYRLSWTIKSNQGLTQQSGGTLELFVSRADGDVSVGGVILNTSSTSSTISYPYVYLNNVFIAFKTGNNGTGTDYNIYVRIEKVGDMNFPTPVDSSGDSASFPASVGCHIGDDNIVWHKGNLPNPASTDASNTFTTSQSIKGNNLRLSFDRPSGQTGQYLGIMALDAGTVKSYLLWDYTTNSWNVLSGSGSKKIQFMATDGEIFAVDGNTKVWHDGRMRWNSSRFEYNNSGSWVNSNPGGVIPLYMGAVPIVTTSTTQPGTSTACNYGDGSSGYYIHHKLQWNAVYAQGRSVYFEAIVLTPGTNTCYVALINNGAGVTGQISTSDGSGFGVIIRSSALTLQNGQTYWPILWSSGSVTVKLLAARFIIA